MILLVVLVVSGGAGAAGCRRRECVFSRSI